MPQYIHLYPGHSSYYSEDTYDLYAYQSNGDLIIRMVGDPVATISTGREAENLILRLRRFQAPTAQRRIDEFLREWESISQATGTKHHDIRR